VLTDSIEQSSCPSRALQESSSVTGVASTAIHWIDHSDTLSGGYSFYYNRMSKHSHKHGASRWTALLILLLSQSVMGRKDKGSEDPILIGITRAPTISPTYEPTANPTSSDSTETPTSLPTTKTPTKSPTRAPTLKRTQEPTIKPTPVPTTEPPIVEQANTTPTSDASETTSAADTDSTTSSSSSNNNAVTTEESGTSRKILDLPLIKVDLELKDGTTFRQAVAHRYFTGFMKDVISSTNSKETNLKSCRVSLTYNATTGEGDSHLRCQAETDVTSELRDSDIAASLTTYFSYFGVQKLKDHLQEQGLPVVDLTVSMGAMVFRIPVNQASSPLTLASNSMQAQEQSNLADTAPASNLSKRANSVALVASIICATGVIVFIGALLLVRKRRQGDGKPVIVMDLSNSDTADDHNVHTPTSLSSIDKSTLPHCLNIPVYEECAPAYVMPPSPSRPESVLSDDLRSYSGLISLEDSLFTSDNSFLRGTVANYQYDASRLDQVIISAKGLSKELDAAYKREDSNASIT
jgi:hypothetical protein